MGRRDWTPAERPGVLALSRVCGSKLGILRACCPALAAYGV